MATELLISKTQWLEANEMLSLSRSDDEGLDSTRKLIGNSTPHRRAVLLAFDSQAIRKGKKAEVTPELRAEVSRLIKSGWNVTKIGAALRLSTRVIRRCASPGLLKPPKMRGRRFTKGFRAEIEKAIREGTSPLDIERKFNLSHSFVWKLRRAIEGKAFRDRRRDRRFTEQEAERIRARLANGETRKALAKELGCSATVLFSIRERLHGY